MDDQTLLSLLADDAPGPSPSLADTVIARGRRARRRRRLTAAASALAVCTAAALVLPGLLVHDAQQDMAASAPAVGSPQEIPLTTAAEKPAAEKPVPDEAYGAPESGGALNEVLDPGPAYVAAMAARGGRSAGRVVLDRVCPAPASCTDRALPAGLKRSLRALLPGLRFTEDPADPAAVRLGEAAPAGDGLLIPVDGVQVRVRPGPGGAWTAG